MTTKKKSAKHPAKMTTDEAVRHLFHKDVVKHVEEHMKDEKKKPTRK